MGIEQDLKTQLARELCAIVDGWSQIEAAALLYTHQSELSRLRRGDLRRFSVKRLLRLTSALWYDVEVHLKPMPRPFGSPSPKSTATVVRYDRYGRSLTER